MESILTILLGGVLLAAALLGGALAVPHPWGIVPTAVVIAGWTAVCCFLQSRSWKCWVCWSRRLWQSSQQFVWGKGGR